MPNTRNKVLLAKIEVTEGVENAPSASTDAFQFANLQHGPSPNEINTNEYNGSLDTAGPIIGGMSYSLSFDVHLKGSGAAGTAPEFGDLLRACGWSEQITSAAVPVAPEACAAGGSTTLANLGSTASSSADAYDGMPINFTGAVAGSSFIADYATGKAATLTDTMSGSIAGTTSYQIPANVLYKPASVSIPSLTFYLYEDGILTKVTGARGTVTYNMNAGGIGTMSFQFQGMFLSKTDAAVPAPTLDATRAPIFKNGRFLINRAQAAISSLSLGANNQLTMQPNPNVLEGMDPAQITARSLRGSIDPSETLVATRDIMADFRAGTSRILHARYGSVVGNRVALTIPQALYVNQTPADRQGVMTVNVPFAALGRDQGAFLCFY